MPWWWDIVSRRSGGGHRVRLRVARGRRGTRRKPSVLLLSWCLLLSRALCLSLVLLVFVLLSSGRRRAKGRASQRESQRENGNAAGPQGPLGALCPADPKACHKDPRHRNVGYDKQSKGFAGAGLMNPVSFSRSPAVLVPRLRTLCPPLVLVMSVLLSSSRMFLASKQWLS